MRLPVFVLFLTLSAGALSQGIRSLAWDSGLSRFTSTLDGKTESPAVRWVLVRRGGEQENHVSLDEVSKPEGDGVSVVGVDFAPVKEGRRLRVQSALLLLRNGGDEPDGVAVRKAGLAAEIRLLMDPTVLPTGANLPLRVYVEGASLGGATVLVLAPDSTNRIIIADREGIAHLTLDQPGRWRLAFHHLRETKQGDTLFTGTLVFEVRK